MNTSFRRHIGKKLHARVLVCLAGLEEDNLGIGITPYAINQLLEQLYGVTKSERPIAGILDFMVKLGYAQKRASSSGYRGWTITDEGRAELDHIVLEDIQKKEPQRLLRLSSN